MSTNDIYAPFDALTLIAPNLAAIRTTAILRGVSYQQAMIATTREWCAALDEAIERHAQEAAINIDHAENAATSAEQRRAWHFEAAEHLDKVNELNIQRIVAVRMLADADTNPVDDRPLTTS